MLDLPAALPADITAAAEEITDGSGTAYQQAIAIEGFLARPSGGTPFELAVEQPPTGHSLGHLRCFLFDAARCGRQGSTEQFVAAFAVLARAAGLPTRVVVGFAGSGDPARSEVSAHDVTAWAEVRFEGIGWVAFDPLPDPGGTNTPGSDAAGGGGPIGDQTPSADAGGDADAGADADTSSDHPATGTAHDRPPAWVGAPVTGGVLVVALPALVRGGRRRRRRRAATPRGRITGAWAEVVDQLRWSGVRVPSTAAVTGVVRAACEELEGIADPLVPLGDLVNRARFAAGEMADSDAAAAWRYADAFARRRRRSRSLRQRVCEYPLLVSVAGRA
jgi:hypothetical protein